jgi:hypothetical protein
MNAKSCPGRKPKKGRYTSHVWCSMFSIIMDMIGLQREFKMSENLDRCAGHYLNGSDGKQQLGVTIMT